MYVCTQLEWYTIEYLLYVCTYVCHLICTLIVRMYVHTYAVLSTLCCYQEEPKAFPAHQPLLDPPTLKAEYNSFLTASREAYTVPTTTTTPPVAVEAETTRGGRGGAGGGGGGGGEIGLSTDCCKEKDQ